MTRATRGLAVLAAVALTAVACGGGGGDDDSAPLDTGGSADTYGHGPQDDDSVTYQPDVVLIGGGPDAIRGVSDDGMVWTMDADAGGMEDLEVGKVMFASSAGAGRVIELDRSGDTVDVTLAPVALTEVVSDAHLRFDEAMSLDSLSVREIPELPGALTEEVAEPISDEGAMAAEPEVALPTMELIAARRPALASEGPSEVSATVAGWKVTAYRTSGTVGLKGEHGLTETQQLGKTDHGSAKADADSGLKVNLDAHLDIDALTVVADVPITRGVIGTSNFEIDGIKALTITVEAGAGKGLSDNRTAKLEIPVQFTRPVIVGGFPAIFTFKFKFLVQTAFTAQNGNISASGTWAIDGPLGFDGSRLTLPTMVEKGTSIVDSIEGVSVGVNGLVVATAFEVGLLFGVPVAGAGPIASFITSLGLTNGSDLGIVKCKQATVTATLTGGVGVNLYDPVRGALKLFFGIDVPKQTTLITDKIFEGSAYIPRVKACNFDE